MPHSTETTFWNNILRAVEAEPRFAKTILGSSGLEHSVIATGVDDNRRRLLLVTGEKHARSAVLVQADIQAAHPSIRVTLIRPVFTNPGRALQELDYSPGWQAELARRISQQRQRAYANRHDAA